MLEIRGVSKTFRKRGVFGQVTAETKAVKDISLTLRPGKTIGVIGQSGSGKSTLARIALRIIDPDTGCIRLDGEDMTALKRRQLDAFRHKVQPVFQDSAGALDPRLTIRQSLSEPLILRRSIAAGEFSDRIAEGLRAVDLPADIMTRRPSELSGGQRQRVGITRALLMEPEYLILDEPVSALDVSVQAQVLNLLLDLQDAHGLSYLFVGHDLAVAEFFCDDILVMRLGAQMEYGSAADVFNAPKSDYARALIASAPHVL